MKTISQNPTKLLQISLTISAVEIYNGKAVQREVGCEEIE